MSNRPPAVAPGSLGRMKEPPNEGPDDWYFDEQMQRWLRDSGRARWRRILAERRAQRVAHPEVGDRWRREFCQRLGLDPDRPPRAIPGVRRNGYPEGMSRHNLELNIETPPYVEQHPELAERLAGRADDRTLDTREVSALRTSIRTRVREQLAAFDPEQNKADGQAFLARFGLS
jgi:hypothetical protein